MRLALTRRLAVGAAALAVVGGGAGTAAACDHNGQTEGAQLAFLAVRHHDHHGAHGLFRVAASYLGLTKEQLKTQLESGKSLAQVADATPGKSAAGLLAALEAAAKSKLDAWVAAGKLSPTQESEMLPKIDAMLARLLQITHS